eukprot:362159-Chlamydomonas_euryale.AAC.5
MTTLYAPAHSFCCAPPLCEPWLNCHAMCRPAMCCPAVSCPAVCCPAVSCPAVCCPAVSCPAVCCLAVCFPAVCCPAVSFPAVYCPAVCCPAASCPAVCCRPLSTHAAHHVTCRGFRGKGAEAEGGGSGRGKSGPEAADSAGSENALVPSGPETKHHKVWTGGCVFVLSPSWFQRGGGLGRSTTRCGPEVEPLF